MCWRGWRAGLMWARSREGGLRRLSRLGQLAAEGVDVGGGHAGGFEIGWDPSPLRFEEIENAQDPLRRAAKLVTKLFAPVRRGLADPQLVSAGQLEVGFAVVSSDVHGCDSGQGEKHRGDDPGPVFAGE